MQDTILQNLFKEKKLENWIGTDIHGLTDAEEIYKLLFLPLKQGDYLLGRIMLGNQIQGID